MSEQTQAVNGHVCPECGNLILEGAEYIDHHHDCPVQTNWWTVQPRNELLCFLCDCWLLDGDSYRMIPMHQEMNDHDILEAAIGKSLPRVRPVCQSCCAFKALPGGMASQDT